MMGQRIGMVGVAVVGLTDIHPHFYANGDTN